MADAPEVIENDGEGNFLPVIQAPARQAPALVDVDTLVPVAKMLAESGFFSDSKGLAQAAVKVMAGQELGIPAIQAMTSIYIVKGKVSLGGMLIATLIRRSGRYTYRIVKHDEDVCEIAFFERDGDSWAEIGRSNFDVGDAEVAGLMPADKDSPWTKHRRNMLFNRAMSNGAKWHCPDVFGGPVYVGDELGATVDANGEIIPLSAPEVPSTHSDAHLPPEQEQLDKAKLLRGALVQVIGGFDDVMRRYAIDEVGAAGLKSMNRGEYRSLVSWMEEKAKEALPDWDQKEPFVLPASEPSTPAPVQEPPKEPEAPAAPAEAAPVDDPAPAAPVEPGSTFTEAKEAVSGIEGGDSALIQAMVKVGATMPAELDEEPMRSAFLAALNEAIA